MDRIRSPNLEQNLAPGQRWVDNFPLYDIVPDRQRPQFDPATWKFSITGAVENDHSWSWEEFNALPMVEVEAHFHCVTTWSKENLVWKGVPTRHVLEQVLPDEEVVQVMAHCAEGYTTNVPLEYLLVEDSLLAIELNGEPIPKVHGYPVRLVVPQLYAWKSAKYCVGLEFQTDWIGGYWEEKGYHMIAEPFEEQRYTAPMSEIRRWWKTHRIASIERPKKS